MNLEKEVGGVAGEIPTTTQQRGYSRPDEEKEENGVEDSKMKDSALYEKGGGWMFRGSHLCHQDRGYKTKNELDTSMRFDELWAIFIEGITAVF